MDTPNFIRRRGTAVLMDTPDYRGSSRAHDRGEAIYAAVRARLVGSNGDVMIGTVVPLPVFALDNLNKLYSRKA